MSHGPWSGGVGRLAAGALATAVLATPAAGAVARASNSSNSSNSPNSPNPPNSRSSSAPPNPTAACLGRPAAARAWAAPLDRRVSWRGRDVVLRDVLERVADAARVRVSYAPDLVPLDRAVCAAFDGVPLGDVLTQLLDGTAVEPVAAGADRVVLAPRHAPAPSAPTVDAATVGRASLLDRVVVTGSAAASTERGHPVAVAVVDRARLAGRGVTSLAGLLDGAVPGVWMWEQPPSGLVARYGSLRGASSFGVSAPKVYIDGIPVANPLLVSRLDADAVERIEVTRGPQGAALHGAGALDGVVSIVTRRGTPSEDGSRVQLRSSAGVVGGDGASPGAFAQDHALALRAGSATRAAGIGIGASSLGEFTPGEFSRRLSAHADARTVGERATATAFARLLVEQAGTPVQAPELGPHALGAATAPSLRQYTLGATVTTAGDAEARWMHALVVGLDGYRLADGALAGRPIPSAADSALAAARGGADRGTVRASSVGRFGDEATRAATLTLAAEHSVLREATAGELAWTPTSGPGVRPVSVAVRSNTGLVAQGALAFRNTLFLSGGVRVDRNDGYAAWDPITLLPMLGASAVREVGGASVTLRAAYGKGIRPPAPSVAAVLSPGVQRFYVRTDLAPETQAGVEAGLDVRLGRRLGLHVTRFDQRASGLVQPALVAADTLVRRPAHATAPAAMRTEGVAPGPTVRLFYQLQNVGEIANRGWELQGTAALGRLSLAGALALVDSRVVRLASGYAGDLRPGDRMLEAPARTVSVSARWTAPRWSASWSLARASDWVGYDRLALEGAAAAGARPGGHAAGGPGEGGAWLRGFWREYDGVTRLRASLSRDLFRGMALTLTGDNLLDRTRGEPDNATVLPGRTVTVGVQARF